MRSNEQKLGVVPPFYSEEKKFAFKNKTLDHAGRTMP